MPSSRQVDRNNDQRGVTHADGYHLDTVTYPDGRQVKYNYGTTGSFDDLLSRVKTISNSSVSDVYALYRYLALDTIVGVDLPAVSGGLSFSLGVSADSYAGLDIFDRMVDQDWTVGSGTLGA
jgi:hypothetical protein